MLLIVIIVALAYRPVSIYLSQDSRAASPTFEAVLPDDKMIQELGGWTRVSPPGNDPVFSYSDEIDGVAVSVSQQPIPASFAGNVPAQVEQLAKNYNATTVIETDDTKAYIGRSARGPQSVILTKNDVLILMQSEKTIDHSAWARYIETLTNLNDRPMSTF